MEGTSDDLEDGSMPDLTEVHALPNTDGTEISDEKFLLSKKCSQKDKEFENDNIINERKFKETRAKIRKTCGQAYDDIKMTFNTNPCRAEGRTTNLVLCI